MKWNEKNKKNIGYKGAPMLPNEFGYLKWLVIKHGIDHVFKMALSLMGEKYREETIEVINFSHEYFTKLYPYPQHVKENPQIIFEYSGIVYVIQEYGYDHLYHYLVDWVEEKNALKFMKRMVKETPGFRKKHDHLYPVKEYYPENLEGEWIRSFSNSVMKEMVLEYMKTYPNNSTSKMVKDLHFDVKETSMLLVELQQERKIK